MLKHGTRDLKTHEKTSLDEADLLSGLAHALGGGEHLGNCVHVLGLNFPRRNAHVGEVLEFQEQVHKLHRVDQAGRNQRCVLVDGYILFSDQSNNVFDHLVGFRRHSVVISSGWPLNSGCSFSTFSRVFARAGFPAVLLTIHLGGLSRNVRTPTPSAATTELRSSFSISADRARESTRSTSATTTMSSVPRFGLYTPIATALPSWIAGCAATISSMSCG